jgi:hypothetical protein
VMTFFFFFFLCTTVWKTLSYKKLIESIWFFFFVSHTTSIKECVVRLLDWSSSILRQDLNCIRWQSSLCLCNSRIFSKVYCFSQHTFVIKLECIKKKSLNTSKRNMSACWTLIYIYIYLLIHLRSTMSI